MLFNSIEFLLFFPITVIIYYLIPGRFRYIWLLVASYYFYMNWDPVYVLLLFFTTLITYLGGLILEKATDDKKRKIVLATVLIIGLTILGYFKYANMFMGLLNKVLNITISKTIPWDKAIVLPVGISFFTLQSLGYLIDVYRKEIYAEHNFLRYALFISFFPQLVAGPIERSKNLLKQLAVTKQFSYDNLRSGLVLTLYGFFLKVVIADRIAIFVDTVYNNALSYPGIYIVLATICFAVQIYCDFYGYSTIAKGVALTMGVSLMDNFNAPYFSKSIKEFWRRWHISLSTWFRDYLYIPLGGNRKGNIRKHINLMIVFAVSGLWHGASLAFVIWGMLHGLYQIIESLTKRVLKKVVGNIENVSYKTFSNKCLKLVVTFILADFAWLFFRANTLSNAALILKQVIRVNNIFALTDQSLFTMGISREYWKILLLAITILTFVDYQKYRGKDVLSSFFRQNWWFRTLATVSMLIFVILFGCYGSAYDVQQFIYFQF